MALPLDDPLYQSLEQLTPNIFIVSTRNL